MKLYTFDPAPNPRRVSLMLKHKGIDIDSEQVDLMKGEQMSGEYSKINPLCTVPALQLDNGDTLCDAIAISLYIDDQFPEKSVFGANALERAKIVAWCQRLYVDGLAAVAEVLRNTNPAFKDRALPGPVAVPQIAELEDRGNLRITAFYQTMEKELQNRQYLVGESLSQADIDLYAVLGFCNWVKRDIPEDCPVLRAWFDTMKQHFGE